MSWLTSAQVPNIQGLIPHITKPKEHPSFDDRRTLLSLQHPISCNCQCIPPHLDPPSPDPDALSYAAVKPPDRRAHPIHALPVELLISVFEFGMRDQIAAAPFKRPQQYLPNFEVTISHVCRFWRREVLKVSSFWTRIAFSEVSHMDRAHAYIRRSKERPLDVYIDTSKHHESTKGITICRNEFEPVFAIVGPHVRRWRTFVLKIRDALVKAQARAAVASVGPASQLETLEIYHIEGSIEWYAENVHPAVKIFHHQMPNLRNLTLVGVKFQWGACPDFIRNLDKLELALQAEDVRPTYAQWENILRACPTLKSLSLRSSGPLVDNNWPKEPFCLPMLEHLSVSDLDPDYLCLLFRHLVLPSVAHLHLELADRDDHCVYTKLIELLSDAAAPFLPALTHLHVHALECPLDVWSAFVQCYSPRLTHLELDLRRLPMEFIVTLLDPAAPRKHGREATPEVKGKGKGKARDVDLLPETTLVCPNLTTLMTRGVPANLMAKVAGTRKSGGRPLEKWTIPTIDRRDFRKEVRLILTTEERAALQSDVKIEFAQTVLEDEDEDDEDEDEEDGGYSTSEDDASEDLPGSDNYTSDHSSADA